MLENVMLSFTVDGSVHCLSSFNFFFYLYFVSIWQHVLLHNNVVTSNRDDPRSKPNQLKSEQSKEHMSVANANGVGVSR